MADQAPQLPAIVTPANGVELITNNVAISIDDVVAVAVSQIADKLAGAIAEKRKDITAAEKAWKATNVTIAEASKKLADEYLEKPGQLIREALALADVAATPETGSTVYGNKGEAPSIMVTLRMRGAIPATQDTVYFNQNFVIPAGPVITDLLADRDAKTKQIEELKADLLLLRRQHSDVPSLERKYRGKIAEQRLSQSADGQELLTKLTGSMESDIRLLGVS